mmetsp:Transcript_17861/g.49531  ORF Transcript_17861/g.49531 Transcript_17861/m.49531 type:complete len:87 (+) Transcript_17861:233-493(+)
MVVHHGRYSLECPLSPVISSTLYMSRFDWDADDWVRPQILERSSSNTILQCCGAFIHIIIRPAKTCPSWWRNSCGGTNIHFARVLE